MFTTLARLLGNDPERVFRLHPIQLSRWLDEIWGAARLPCVLDAGDAFRTIHPLDVIDAFDLPTQPAEDFLAPSGINDGGPFEWSGRPAPIECPPRPWHHLIYAYLLESTGIVEVFAEVVRRLVVGETIGTLQNLDAARWLRATEGLFFRDSPHFSIASVFSEVRPYERVNRRNAYARLLGVELGHPVPPPWAATGPFADWKAATGAVSGDFPQKWTELLRQVWLGIENRNNQSGPNPADATYIALLCASLGETLRSRRRGGALAREEFAYVSMLSWFHLTVASDTQIIRDLQVSAVSPAERLGGLAQKVGMTPAARSRELFELAEPASTILRGVELGLFDTAQGASALFLPGPVADDMSTIINNWQSATGERVKERPVGTVVPGSGQPLRVPVPGVVAPVAPPAAPMAPAAPMVPVASATSPNGPAPVAVPSPNGYTT